MDILSIVTLLLLVAVNVFLYCTVLVIIGFADIF